MHVWVELERGRGDFPDRRLKARSGLLLGDFGQWVGGTVPLACQDWGATTAADRFFDNPRVDEGLVPAGHFAALGLGRKHLPLGRVLGPDGRKVKSSGGQPLLAEKAFDLVVGKLAPTPEPKKLAWNVLAFGFLQSALGSACKFDRPPSPSCSRRTRCDSQ
jgi:hypothetical protein